MKVVDDCCEVGLPPYDPPGGTPAGAPAFCDSKKAGSLRDTSLNGVRAWPRSRQRLQALIHNRAIGAALTITALIASCLPAGAAGSGMPWESPLTRILESIEGPVAKVCAVVIIIVTGLSLAFGDMSGGFRRLVQVVFGLSIAFAATSFFLSFFSFAGGALIE
jgi:type IV secretion system protein TrbC